MGNTLKFNSSVCTSIEQSQRLLELGLKPETADMVLIKELAYDEITHCTYDADTYMIRPIDYIEGEEHRGHIPAWSLHRLLLMLYNREDVYPIMPTTAYDDIIDDIENVIKCGGFKEYLK